MRHLFLVSILSLTAIACSKNDGTTSSEVPVVSEKATGVTQETDLGVMHLIEREYEINLEACLDTNNKELVYVSGVENFGEYKIISLSCNLYLKINKTEVAVNNLTDSGAALIEKSYKLTRLVSNSSGPSGSVGLDLPIDAFGGLAFRIISRVSIPKETNEEVASANSKLEYKKWVEYVIQNLGSKIKVSRFVLTSNVDGIKK